MFLLAFLLSILATNLFNFPKIYCWKDEFPFGLGTVSTKFCRTFKNGVLLFLDDGWVHDMTNGGPLMDLSKSLALDKDVFYLSCHHLVLLKHIHAI